VSNPLSISPLIAVVRAELRAQRCERRARQELRADLAQYNSPTERAELQAIMERHSHEETAEIRAILADLPVS
jgi:hypothetical protein